MGFTKACTAGALVAIFASIALLVATMFIPNWVKAVWRVPGSDDCTVGNLGAFEAELEADAECAAGSEGYPLEGYANFKSDTLEFWPLFPMQATGYGNKLPGVANTTFESCDESLNNLDAAVAGLVGPAAGAAGAASQSLRGVALGGAELVSGIVAGLEDQLDLVDNAANAYSSVVGFAAAYGVDAVEAFYTGANSSTLESAFVAVADGANLASGAQGENKTMPATIKTAFAGISLPCGCVGKPGGCPFDTTVIIGTVQAVFGAAMTCDNSAAAFGQQWLVYAKFSGNSPLASPNALELGQFVGGSAQLFADIRAGLVTDANRFAPLYKDTAQLFLASEKVRAFLVAAAVAANSAISEPILDNMLGLVRVCACHLKPQTDAATPNAYNETCDTSTAGLTTAVMFANNLVPAPNAYAQAAAYNADCTEILSLVAPALTFYGQEKTAATLTTLGTQAYLASIASPAFNATIFAEAKSTIVSTKSLFSEFNMQIMLENDIEFDFVNGPVLNAVLMGKGAGDRVIEGVLPFVAACACTVNATASASAYCNPTIAATNTFVRNLVNGSPDIITSGPACFAYVAKLSQQGAYGAAWSGYEMASDRTGAEEQCEDDNTDQEHITLGRTMLIVSLPILIIGTLAAVLAANKACNDNAEGFKLVAVVAGVCAIVSAGLTLFGLLHVQSAPVYAAVGAPCAGPGICYESDFAAKIALGAALAPIIAGVSLLVCAFVGVSAEPKSEESESPRDSQVANPKFSI